MGIKVANNAFATLASGINSSATSITLTTGQGARFPSLGAGDYFYATLIDTSNNLEIVKCTARSTDVLTVVRAQESTTARAYSAGDRIEIRLTAATFTDATQALPTQTGNAGKYLTTDGTNASWATVSVTPTAVSDQTNSSTGYFDLPAGTTAQRPGSPASGMVRFNTTTGEPEWYDSAGAQWLGFSKGANYSVEYLVVAGGGGGGGSVTTTVHGGGGGGAGGYQASSLTVTSTTQYTITVGAGGNGGGIGANAGGAGTSSSAFSTTSVGGGGGGFGQDSVNSNGNSGGSGGGATRLGTGGSGTAGQGNAGGNGTTNGGSNDQPGAGGGGASAAGGGGSAIFQLVPGNGGAGTQWLNGTTYAGGGGGGASSSGKTSGGNGGAGGGGNGGNGSSGSAGTANTGGGGGGGVQNNSGGAGGSGVVIVRYVGTQRGVGGTVTQSGGYTYHTFTTSGTFTA